MARVRSVEQGWAQQNRDAQPRCVRLADDAARRGPLLVLTKCAALQQTHLDSRTKAGGARWGRAAQGEDAQAERWANAIGQPATCTPHAPWHRGRGQRATGTLHRSG